MSIPHLSAAAGMAAALAAPPASLQSSDDGLTLSEILASVPHDAAAFVVYALLAGSAYLVWWANRHSGDRRREDGKDAPPGPGAGPVGGAGRPRRAS